MHPSETLLVEPVTLLDQRKKLQQNIQRDRQRFKLFCTVMIIVSIAGITIALYLVFHRLTFK